MAVNEKTVYAVEHTTYGGRLFRPGEQLSGRMPEHALRGAQESGLTTDSHAAAERAKENETARRQHVAEQIRTRSEKRDYSPHEDRR